MPPTPASLIEEVGERILVFPGVARQLDDDSLVFFHLTIEIIAVITPSPLRMETEK